MRVAHVRRLFVEVSGKIESSPRTGRAALTRRRKRRQFDQRTVICDWAVGLLNDIGDRAQADRVPAVALDLYLGWAAQHRLTGAALQCTRQQVRYLTGGDETGVPARDHFSMVSGRGDHRAPTEPAKNLGGIGAAAFSQFLQRPERNVDT